LKNQKHNLPTTKFEVLPPSEKTLSSFQQAGKKEGGLSVIPIRNFCSPADFGWWVCIAEGNVQVNQNFAQKKFALRPIIATKIQVSPVNFRETKIWIFHIDYLFLCWPFLK